MRLLQTLKVKNGHYHIVYVNDQTGQGMTSVDKGHSHPVIYQESVSAQLTPSPDSVVAGTMGGGWMVAPAADGHTHELTGYVIKPQKPKGEASDIVSETVSLWKSEKEYEADAVKKAKESEGFYSGDGQWDTKTKADLNDKERAALVINEIEPKIDQLAGYQRQNRTDFKFMPTEGGDARVADILNVVVKNITEGCDYPHEESRHFEDEAVVGRGHFNVYADFDRNIQGDIVIERFPWDDVNLGPHSKDDCSDLEHLTKHKWMSLAKVKQLWPDKAEDVQKDMDSYLTDEGQTHVNYSSGQYENSTNSTPVAGNYDPELIDIAKKEYRILEQQRKEYFKAFVVVRPDDDFVFSAEGWNAADVKAVKTMPGFNLIERNAFRMRFITVAGGVLLDDTYPDLPEQDFTVITTYAKKRGKKWWGKVESAKDPQREVNKEHSQLIDIVNKVAAYGWFYDDQTFGSVADEEQWKRNCTSAGFTQKVMDVNHTPKKEEGVKFPSELAGAIEMNSAKIREIMNVNLELMGQGRASQSGIAIAQQKQQGLIGNEYLFDNLSRTKKRLGRRIVAYIQRLYTPERIMRIVDNQDMKDSVKLAGQPLYAPQPPEAPDMAYQQYKAARRAEILALLNDADLTKYDVTVSESPYSPSMRLANFMIWSDLAGKGIPVPPQLLVNLSDLPEKEKVIEDIQQMQQGQMEMEREKMNTEKEKALIAAQAKARNTAAPQGGVA